MCCFSRAVRSVSATRIFARPLPGGDQLLAYGMRFDAAEDLAMVLPLPTPPEPGDDAVEFLDLSSYERFFEDLDAAFPAPPLPRGRGRSLGVPPSAAQLEVHRVGAFEASFVPARAAFRRLDPRFRLSEAALDALPVAPDWGFAVFKLRQPAAPAPGLIDRLRGASAAPSSPRGVHPMAFRFPRRDPGRVFFPTVHVHDGEVHERARFDHALYLQHADDPSSPGGPAWVANSARVADRLDLQRAAGLVDAETPAWKLTLRGVLPNRDTVVAVG